MIVADRGEILTVPVSTTDGFRQGATPRRFGVPAGDSLLDVVRGEQRFLIANPLDLSSSTNLELVPGWHSLLERAR